MHFYTDRLRDFLKHKIFKAHNSDKISPAQRVKLILLRDELEGTRTLYRQSLREI